jgi:hypothetical protein
LMTPRNGCGGIGNSCSGRLWGSTLAV